MNWIKIRTADPEICSILAFLKKAWYLFLHHILCLVFQGKCFLCFILNGPDFIASLSLFLKIFGKTCITIVSLQGCDVINFEIDLISLSSSFATRLKSQDKNVNLENEKSSWGEIKSIFHHFNKAFSCQKLSQTWECTFKRRKT